MINRDILSDLYLNKRFSSAIIAGVLHCSGHKVDYWLKKHRISKRSISEAVYEKKNPDGDPFKIIPITDFSDAFLHGLGIGLYWGEGNKRDKYAVRLGNTDARLIKKFIEFLQKSYDIKKDKLRFGLQIFNDVDPQRAIAYWIRVLDIRAGQFQKPTISSVRGPGTYKNKSTHGVMTVYFNNKKLRDVICSEIEKL
jgi:hypothetical protein